ncbi:putative regulator PrlF [compost metagenome]
MGDLELSKEVVISGLRARLAVTCYQIILSVFISFGVPMATATLNSRGQITIPAEVRTALVQRQGDRVEFVELDGGQCVMVVATQPVQRLKGMIRKPKTAVSIEAMK